MQLGNGNLPPGLTTDYVSSILYDKFEQRTQMTQGNNVVTNYSYDANTRRLTSLSAGKFGLNQPLFQNLQYTFDPVGNITQLQNAVAIPASGLGGPVTQKFGYDDLYRLTSAGTTRDGAFQPNAATSRQYTLNMSYDSIHNIKSKIQDASTTVSGVTTPDYATTYPFFAYQYDPVHPHQLSTILRSDIIQGVQSFFYDANGNHVTSFYGDDLPQPPVRTMAWDEENRLLRVCQTDPLNPANCLPDSSYQYDAGGERTVKRVTTAAPAGGLQTDETVYVNPNFVVRNGSIYTKSYFAGTQRIASRVLDATTLQGGFSRRRRPRRPQVGNFFSDVYYFHPDHLGSTGFTTTDTGAVYEHFEYFPFGETWVQQPLPEPSAPPPLGHTPYLFTGKELEQDTGLYYYGARYYDPRVSVWQSPDPVLGSYANFQIKCNT